MENSYALKRITFLGRSVSILCQNKNGPCPLLAICNVLLLRGVLTIPKKQKVIYEEEVIARIANHLIEFNPPLSNPELALSQEATMNDVIALLPSLLVGLDVNVKFRHSSDFEYTTALATFDLVDITLVHGWLVDPLEKNMSESIGKTSYNQLVTFVVEYNSAVMAEKKGDSCVPYQVCLRVEDMVGVIVRESDKDILKSQQPMAMSTDDSHLSAKSDDIVSEEYSNNLLDDSNEQLSDELANLPVAEPSNEQFSAEAAPLSSAEYSNIADISNDELIADYSNGQLLPESNTRLSADLTELLADFVQTDSNEQLSTDLFQQLSAAANELSAQSSSAESAQLLSTACSKERLSASVFQIMTERKISRSDATDIVYDLFTRGPLISSFLHETASQLTTFGLHTVTVQVPENALVVFFRNNHFSTLFKYHGQLFLLVTDAGYMDEPQVVWEHLCAIDGNTVYLNEMFAVPGQQQPMQPLPAAAVVDTSRDYEMAVRLHEDSQGGQPTPSPPPATPVVDTSRDYEIAFQLQEQSDRADQQHSIPPPRQAPRLAPPRPSRRPKSDDSCSLS